MKKTDDKNISIYIRGSKRGDTIQLCKKIEENGKAKYKRLATGAVATEENLIYYAHNATKEWDKLYQKSIYKKISFRDFTEKTALKFINENAGKKTQKDNYQKIEDYIYPFFGDMDIKKISTLDINTWQLELKAKKGSDLTKRCKSLLARILNEALINKLIEANPCTPSKKIIRKHSEKKIREIYYKEEIRAMIDGSNGWLRVFILCFVYMGIRTNEIIALKWEDVNWEEDKLHICRAVVNGKTEIDGKTIPPKTGQRLIDIPRVLKDELLKLKENSKTEWIFPSKNNSHYKSSIYITRRHFKPLLSKLGIPYKGLYSLRHSYATHAIIAGVSIIYIAKQLGHADPSTTLKFYTKYIEQMGVEAKAKLDKLLIY